jgi:alkanesulfonate monooxygenase
MDLRFHWRLTQGGEKPGASRSYQASLKETGLPDLEAQVAICRHAEELGIDSMLTDFGWSKPDPILLACAIGMQTKKVKFIVAYRSGLVSPTTFVQQLNTLSVLISGRFSLNIVAGHSPEEQKYYGDFLLHDERYERTEEFLAICHAFWKGSGIVNFNGKYFKIENGKLNTPFVSEERTFPELYIAGNSPAAQRLAITQGSCWMVIADTPENLRHKISPVLDQGKEVGIRLSVITRRSREEAVRAAHELIGVRETWQRDRQQEKQFVQKSDSVSINSAYRLVETEWLNSYLWTGAIASHGAPAIAIVGSAEEVAAAIMEYKRTGVTQFIFSGWPKLEEMIIFGRDVLPLVRKYEKAFNKANGDTVQDGRREANPMTF